MGAECNCGKNQGLKTLTMVVKGMSCHHCQAAVEGAVKRLAGVKEAEVDLEQGILSFTFDPGQVSLSDVQQAVVETGYEVPRHGEETYR